jgi:hypothetical protein
VDSKQHIEQLRKDVDYLDDLSGYEFEEVVAELLTSLGWDISLTPPSRDGGIDMLGISRDPAGFESTWAVECKRYRADRPVGVAVLRALHGVKEALRLPRAVLVTTSGITREAAAFAQLTDIQIADRDVLAQWISDYEHPSEERPVAGSRFRSCFVSHSSRDRLFVDHLVSALRQAEVRVWYAPDELKPGRKIQEDVAEAIEAFDRLIVVLSKESLKSPWVQSEIRRARRREISQNVRVLFPISLMPFDELKSWELFDGDLGQDLAIEIREYFIPDFSNWQQPAAFDQGLGRLLEGLASTP